jgi:hypothetical protein
MIQIVKPYGLNWELGIRGYKTKGDQYRAIAMLRKQGFNYFICFKDRQSDYALQIGHADWVREGDVYIDR